jgi:hypothetical protein
MRSSRALFFALVAGCNVYELPTGEVAGSKGGGDSPGAGGTAQHGAGNGAQGGVANGIGATGTAGSGGETSTAAQGAAGSVAGGRGSGGALGGGGGIGGFGGSTGSNAGAGAGGTGPGGARAGNGGTSAGRGGTSTGGTSAGGGGTRGSGGGTGGGADSGTPLHAFLENRGAFSIEAEHFTASLPGMGAAQGITWQNSAAEPNTSGSCEQAEPNVGVNMMDSVDGPQLAFDLKFSGTGIYYVWLRILGANNQSDSVHVAMDTSPPVTYGGQGIGAGSTVWAWIGTITGVRAPDGSLAAAQINVTAPGYHTLRVYMREDGVAIDKIVLDQSQAALSGMGPSESARE